MLTMLLLGVLIDPQTVAPAATATVTPSAMRVVVTAPVYQPDGAVTLEAAALSTATPAVVHVFSRRTLCDSATTGATEPSDAGFGWRLTTNVVSATPTAVVLSVDWRRLWDRGQKIGNGPSGTVQLTLHPGDRIPLDHIPNPAATDACRAVGMGLEVTLTRSAPPGQIASALLPLGATDGGAAALDAQLWLLHTLPAGTQQAQHQTVRLPGGGAAFNFAPVKLATAQGEVTVEIAGSFRRYRSPTGAEFVMVTMARNISGGVAPAGGISGGTSTLIPLPDPSEVLALEIPSPGRTMGAPAGRGGRGGGGGGRAGTIVARPGGPGATGAVASGGGGASSGTGGAGAAGGTGTTGSTTGSATGSLGRTGGGVAVMSARGRGGFGGGSAEALATTMLEGHTFSLRLRLAPAQKE